MDGVTYYTALPEGHCDQYEMVMSTDFEAACDERDAALAREAALREQCGGMQMSLDEAAEREAALREELATTHGELNSLLSRYSKMWDAHDKCAESLTAAEQRNSELVELLRDIYNQNELSGFDDRRILDVIDPRPAESGASE